MKTLVALGFLVASLQPAVAEQADASTTTAKPVAPQTQAVANPPFSPGVTGVIDLRPSIDIGTNEYRSENTLGLGYQFSPDFSIDYTQYFNTVFNTPGADKRALVGDDGFLRGKFNNIWKSVQNDLTFNMEQRIYMPTKPSSAANGMIAASRTYFSLVKKFSPYYTLTLQEIPILYGYGRNGNGDLKSGFTANPIFENRVYLINDFQITPRVVFSLPLLVWATRYRDMPSTDTWGYMVMIWPELDLQVGPKTSVGLAYYSDNFLKEGAWRKGVASVVLHQTL